MFIYIMASAPNGILYVGVTNDLIRLVWEHKEGLADGFTKRYAIKNLVYFEQCEDPSAAIAREKQMKHWQRAWKVRRILETNPEWCDLCEEIVG